MRTIMTCLVSQKTCTIEEEISSQNKKMIFLIERLINEDFLDFDFNI
jgi:hypothetical protein